METVTVLFWFTLLTCLTGLGRILLFARAAGFGWVAVFLLILLVDVFGGLCQFPAAIFVAFALFLLLVVAPGLVSRFYARLFFQQRYAAARRLALVIRCLHPADGWREQPEIIRALDLAQHGETAAAGEILRRYQGLKSLTGLAAQANFYRLTGQWEAFLAWHEAKGAECDRHRQALFTVLRAKGEVNDRRGLVRLYEQHRAKIEKIPFPATRDLCRLSLFAFCGQPEAVARLFAGSLAILPAATREFWLATAEHAAGAVETARARFERLLPAADPVLRLAIRRRLDRLAIPPEPLDDDALHILAEAARDHSHEEKFTAPRSLFARAARTTQILILLNLLMFAAEIFRGGSTNPETLYRLGALYVPAVLAGEWWRLLAAMFLHWGPLHLFMNMLALAMLGPMVEFALGWRRFLLLYLLTGLGSMAVVLALTATVREPGLLVGASGAIMGLIGATGALLLRGWRRDKARAARRRLGGVLVIVLVQSTFDTVVPQVSMTAHLSGVALGFLVAFALRDRLATTPPQPPPERAAG